MDFESQRTGFTQLRPVDTGLLVTSPPKRSDFQYIQFGFLAKPSKKEKFTASIPQTANT